MELTRDHPLERPYHPDLQVKMRKTIKLMREGADPERYESQDVLDPRTLYILNERSEKFREHTFERPNLPRRSVFGEKRVLVLLVDFKTNLPKNRIHPFQGKCSQ